ncbi:MAG: ABC transporter ATP-binding protein [Microbacterium sp.]|nr:ABC transporter ATP-binding protein [Microbacterium sp.]MBA4346846.1 ABC transporter ATP-binding protein [Microbacterium sp.]
MTSPAPLIVSVTDASKRFVLHKDKSVKERLLNLRRARQHRVDFWALHNITLDIESGTTVGLVGHNGSGKSTLLKVIGGIIQPTSGTVKRRGRIAALLELGAGFHPDLTGRENVYLNASILGLSRAETDRYFDDIVEFSEIGEFIDSQVKFYSSGMYVRLAFSVAIHVDPDLLLVDEVLAVGDEPFQRKCMDKIQQFQREGRTIVFVSHSADQVMQLCDRVIVLDHGRMIFDGDAEGGIAALRESFVAGTAATDTTGATVLEELTTGARVESVRLTSTKTNLAGDFLPGGDISVAVRYRIASVDPGLIVGIGIQTPAGNAVYGINTHGMSLGLPSKPGTYDVAFLLPDSALAKGEYHVRATIYAANRSTIDDAPLAASFRVEDQTAAVGVVRFDTTATVGRLD